MKHLTPEAVHAINECIDYLKQDTLVFVKMYHTHTDHELPSAAGFSIPSCCDIYIESLKLNGLYIDNVIESLKTLLLLDDIERLKQYFIVNQLFEPKISLNRILLDKPKVFINAGKLLGVEND